MLGDKAAVNVASARPPHYFHIFKCRLPGWTTNADLPTLRSSGEGIVVKQWGKKDEDGLVYFPVDIPKR